MEISSKNTSQNSGKEAETQPQNNSNSSVEVYKLPNLPFAIIKKESNAYVIVLGKHMITPKIFISIEAAEEWLSLTDWESILNVIGIYVDFINNLNK